MNMRDRCAGGDDLTPLLDLGCPPIGGLYWSSAKEARAASAPLVVCRSQGSGLVQLREPYDSSHYLGYTFSGHSVDSYHQHIRATAAALAQRVKPDGLVFEVGASDGAFLAAVQEQGLRVLGVEPSRSLVERARAAGLAVEQGYVGAAWVQEHPALVGACDAIVMRHVLEHLDDPHAIFSAITRLAAPGARFLIEVPSWEGIVTQQACSSIFHEHVAYYTATTLWQLLAMHGWGVVEHRTVPIHGASHLVECMLGDHRLPPPPGPTLEDERSFISGVHAFRQDFRTLIAEERRQGHTIAGYGASHRTALLLELGDLTQPGTLSALYDQNPLLQELFQPPAGIPIRNPAVIATDRPDTLIIFAISYTQEIVARLADFRAQGGRLLLLDAGRPRMLVTAEAR